MTRARRVSQDEGIYDGDELVGVLVPEGDVGYINTDGEAGTAKRFCKACEKVALASERDSEVFDVVVAPTGTAHLDAGEGLTLCGRETGDW